jgi:hypothetical protein
MVKHAPRKSKNAYILKRSIDLIEYKSDNPTNIS